MFFSWVFRVLVTWAKSNLNLSARPVIRIILRGRRVRDLGWPFKKCRPLSSGVAMMRGDGTSISSILVRFVSFNPQTEYS